MDSVNQDDIPAAVCILKKQFMEKMEEIIEKTCSKCDEVSRTALNSKLSAKHLICPSCYDSLSCIAANVLKELPSNCKFTHNGCQVFITQ